MTHFQSLCRDCLYYWQGDNAGTCPKCKQVRIVQHPHLFSLTIAHLDCDSFYTAIEKRDNSKIASSPVLVGRHDRGVVAAACYIARIYGVRSAMPMFKALQQCPNAVVIPPNMEKYKKAGAEIRHIMRRYTELIEPLSIDEAYLGFPPASSQNPPPCLQVAKLAKDVENEVGLTISIGLSYNKFLAKLSSDLDKPQGFSVIGRDEAKEFLATLPVNALWGVGPQFSKKLMREGYINIGHVQRAPRDHLIRKFGKYGHELHLFSHGEDDRKISPLSASKSVSAETTFSKNLHDFSDLKNALAPLCKSVSDKMQKNQIKAQTVQIKLKDAQFKNITRSKKQETHIDAYHDIFKLACDLLQNFLQQAGQHDFRLIGVGVSDLQDAQDIQKHDYDLFSPSFQAKNNDELTSNKQQENLYSAIQQIKHKFGNHAISYKKSEQ